MDLMMRRRALMGNRKEIPHIRFYFNTADYGNNPTNVLFTYNGKVGFPTLDGVTMCVDGVKLDEPVYKYTFSQAGEHEVDITLPNNQIPNNVDGFAYGTNAYKIVVEDGITGLGSQAFYAALQLKIAELPENNCTLGVNCFNYCAKLERVNIPNNNTSFIGCFQCYKLTNVVLPNRLESLGTSAFYRTYELRNITLPQSLTTIEQNAFFESGLIHINIPSGVTAIKDSVFQGCTSLVSVVFNSNTPPTLTGTNIFSGTTCNIYVPDGSVNTYKTHSTNWSNLADRIKPMSELNI